MAKIHIRDVRVEDDLLALLPNVRQMDVDEWGLGSGKPLRESVELAIRSSHVARVAVHGKSGEPFAMWGVGDDLSDQTVGIVWALGTDDMTTQGRALQLHWKDEMKLLERDYHLLACGVMERNKQHIKWLRSMGFRKAGIVATPGRVSFNLYTRETA